MKETPGLHRGYRSQSSSSTAIVPPRRYSIERLNHLGRRYTGGLDIGKINHAAIQAGVLKRQIALPYVTFMDGPLSELPTNYRHGLATVSTEIRRRADDWVLVQDSTSPQLNNPQSITNNHNLAKQNEGFAKFLKRHSSPTHQRVTAGGRIVPMEATPPPQLKPFTKYNGTEDPIKRNIKSFIPGQNYLSGQTHLGNKSNSVGGTTNEQIHRNMSTLSSRVSPFSIGSPSRGNNHSVSSPRTGIGHTAAPSIESTPWWLQYNPEQRNLGGLPTIPSATQMALYPMSLYPSVSQQSNHLVNTADKANGSGLLNVSPSVLHDPVYSNPTFSSGLLANTFSNVPQLGQTPGPGVMLVPFPPTGDGAGPSYQASSAKTDLQGTSASCHLMPPDSRNLPASNTNSFLQANTPGSSFVATPTAIEQARQAYEAITERIEQFNREMVLQNPALDDVQQEAIAKYRLDMATERARTHKLLKTLEGDVKKTASHSSGASSDANKDEVDTKPKVQFRLPSNSPSRGLNVDAPVWQPSKTTKDRTSPRLSPSKHAAQNEEHSGDGIGPVAQEEAHLLNLECDNSTAAVAAGSPKGVVFHKARELSGARSGKGLPRLAGIGPLGSAGYPISELLSVEDSDKNTPNRLFVWVDESGRRTDELPLHILEHYNKELEERIRAGKAGEKPNFEHLEKPSDYDYYIDFRPIDVVGWILASGHFGVRKDLREELASEPEDKRKRGPDIRDWRDWRKVQEWDQRFDAARHCHGVESPVWTEKFGWIICGGEDRQPPDANDNKWMTEYERLYWIRKPESVFSKLKPTDSRIEYMENTCDECSRWSIDDNATVYTDDPRWLDFQAQFDRLIAAGEDVGKPDLHRLEEPVTLGGKRLTMEESDRFWRNQLQEGKKYRDEHKMHKSLHCPKHAKISDTKEKEIKTWISNVRTTKNTDPRAVSRIRASDISPCSLVDTGMPPDNHADIAKPMKLSGVAGQNTTDNVDDDADRVESPSRSHKGISSVSISAEVANATAKTPSGGKADAHANLLQRLKSFHVPQGNERTEKSAVQRPGNVVADARARFPFRGNLSRHA